MKRVPFALLAIIAASALAGCVGPTGLWGAPCADFRVPPPHLGFQAVYDAEGPAWFEPVSPRPVLDRRALGGDRGSLTFLPGERLIIASEPESRPRIFMDGSRPAGAHVTYWMDSGTNGDRLAFRDAWISMEHGNLLHAINRNNTVFDDGAVQHFTRFGQINHPPILMASLFWDRGVASGTELAITVPKMMALPWAMDSTTLSIRVEDVRQREDHCQATVEWHIHYPWSSANSSYSGTFVLSSEHPLPVQYTARLEHPDVESLNLTLANFTDGTGDALPPWRSIPWPDTTFDRGPAEDGFLPRGPSPFDTSFEEALEAINSDDTRNEWLRSNPDARITTVEHAVGRPGGGIVDEWEIVWTTPDLEHRVYEVTKRRILPVAGETLMDVRDSTMDNQDLYPENDTATFVTLDALARLHERTYGEPLTTIACTLYRDEVFVTPSCDLGPPEVTGHGYAGEGKSGFVWGLIVDIQRGWILQEGSYTDAPVGPAAS